MKKVFAFISFLFIFAVGYLINPQPVSAHVDLDDPSHVNYNHFACTGDGVSGCYVRTDHPDINCAPGFTDYCDQFNNADCNGAINLHCIVDPDMPEPAGYKYDGFSQCVPCYEGDTECIFETALLCNDWLNGRGPRLDIPDYNYITQTCNQILDESLAQSCKDCMGGDGEYEDSGGRVWTALGCINTNPTKFIAQFLQIAVGLAGGIAFLMLIFGAFLMITSAGDPKAVENARGVITGAVSGLLIIIFSVVILNFIGVQVLDIPGF